MTTIVFAGPTLTDDDRRAHPAIVWRGPAAQGDVVRALRETPTAIGIVDGYFETVPSVWHKEVLWAMSCGVRVYGAASMGALRAAELHAYGMRGVGEVFARFVDGTYEDDDEVAVVHGPAESGWRALSDAMVNIRATLDAAVEAGVIPAGTRDALVAHAKAQHYPDRSLAALARRHADLDGMDALRTWLPAGRVDRKRLDALALLDRVTLDRDLGPERPAFAFEHTDAWEAMRRAIDAAA